MHSIAVIREDYLNIFTSIRKKIMPLFLFTFLFSCSFDVKLGTPTEEKNNNQTELTENPSDDDPGDVPHDPDEPTDPPQDPVTVEVYNGIKTNASRLEDIRILNGRIIESSSDPISHPTVTLDDISTIDGYSDLLSTCDNNGYHLGTFDMELGAGRIDVPLTERANEVTISSSSTFPYYITQSDTEYILTEDIVTEGDAIIIEASNITLNLNGNTISYGTAGSCQGNVYGNGCNPINFYYTPMSSELAGLEIIYHSPDTDGVYAYYGRNMNVHHNTFEDQGMVVSNRHQGISVFHAPAGNFNKVHHNLITSARQGAIRAGLEQIEIYNNEIFVNSYHTNSVAITAGGGGNTESRTAIYNNKIIARGYLPIGIWPDDHTDIYNNFVYAERTRGQTQPGNEYANPHGACYRQTWGDNDIKATCNHFELKGGRLVPGTTYYSRGKAVWIGLTEQDQTEVLENNFIRGTNDDGVSRAQAIGIVYNFPSNLIFRDNVISSNFSNVTLADDYGQADGFPQFIGNHFVKEGDNENYATVKSEYSSRPSTGTFLDSTFAGGASFGPENIDLELCGSGLKEIHIGRSGSITPTIDYIITNNTATRDAGSAYTIFETCGFNVIP